MSRCAKFERSATHQVEMLTGIRDIMSTELKEKSGLVIETCKLSASIQIVLNPRDETK